MKAENRFKLSELIEKINWLHKNLIQSGNSDLNPLEADLMISYLEEARNLTIQIKAEGSISAADLTINSAEINAKMKIEVEDADVELQQVTVPLEETEIQNVLEEATLGEIAVPINGDHTEVVLANGAVSQSINDRFASKAEELEEQKLVRSVELQSLIDLNLKIGFIRDLFKGNESMYRSTIDRLGTAKSLADGIRYLEEEFKSGFETKAGEDSYEKLLALFRRCFQ